VEEGSRRGKQTEFEENKIRVEGGHQN